MKIQTKSLNKMFFGLIAIFTLFLLTTTGTNAATRTWDGGGATNNWSDAANWSGDTAPTASDDAIFNNTSVKDAVIDQNFSIVGVQIATGYTGTITQPSANLTVGSFTQSAGIFQGGSGTLTVNGTLQITGGSFAGGSGLITGGFGFQVSQSGGIFSSAGNLELTTFTLSGGTFNAPNGTMTVIADWTHTSGGTFNAGSGTVKFTGYSVYNCANSMTVNVNVTEDFNNLQFDNQACNTRYIAFGDTLIAGGDLRLSNGSVNSGRVRPLGSITIDSSFSANAGSTIVELNTPNKNYVINNPATTVSMLPVEMNATTSTLTSSGAGKLNFYGLTLTNGTLNQPNAIWDFTAYPGYAQSGGTFNGSAAQLNIANGINGNILTGGIFNGGTGLISGGWGQTGGTFSTSGNMNAAQFTLSGGTFNAPSGVLDILGGFTHTSGGTFNAGTGTVQTSVIPGVYGMLFDVNASETFYNLKFNGTYNSANHVIATGDNLIVNGTLTFNGRGVSGGSITANGNVTHTNYGAYRNGTTIVKFEDTATRTVTLCGDAGSCNNSPEFDTQPMLVNNPNITINAGLTANGSMIVPALTLQQGTFNQGAGRVAMTTFNQSGGTYNGGTFAESFGSLNSFTYFTLTGGDFNAAPSMSLTGNFTHTTATGNFNEGTGTIYFYSTFFGTNGTVDVNGSETFYNVSFFSGNGTNIATDDTLVINGTTTLRSGTLNGGTIDQKGDVLVSQANVGGSFQGGTTNVIFSGAANQTFNNFDGFASFGGTWTINKPNSTPLAENSFAPAAPTTLFLSGFVGRGLAGSYVPFSIVRGNVVQTGNFSHYFSSLTLSTAASFVNEFAGAITLSGDVTNNGVIRLNANGSGCQADSILLRSSSATQRNWNGAGYFFMTDVDVSGQTGTPIITVYSGTNSGNNGTNWIFDPSCAAPTASNAVISGSVLSANGSGIPNAVILLTDASGQSRAVSTNSFGLYKFENVAAGQTIVLTVKAKQFVFSNPTRIISVSDDVSNADFIANTR